MNGRIAEEQSVFEMDGLFVLPPYDEVQKC